MRRWRKYAKRLLVLAVLALALTFGVLMYTKVCELTNQLSYLQDTTNVILSDVGGITDNIAQTLEEENSRVESYAVDVADMDFTRNTYTVDVTVIPKEYTDATEISAFFGTKECALTKDGYEYHGSIALPLDNDYAGNLTFLFSDGKKKTTEVYSGYAGIRNALAGALSAEVTNTPRFRDGALRFSDELTYALDGGEQFSFSKLEFTAEYNGETIYTHDLVAGAADDVQEQQETADKQEELSTEPDADNADAQTLSYPVTELSGTQMVSVLYEPTEAGTLVLSLTAETTDGYRFVYMVFSCELTAEDEDVLALDAESFDWTPSYVAYDKKGAKLVLED